MKKLMVLLGLIATVLVGTHLSSCTSTKMLTTDISNDTQANVSGAQLWSNNCIRCHNIPSPNAYDDNEWTAIVNHMQKVAGLTVDDSNKVLEFMQSAN